MLQSVDGLLADNLAGGARTVGVLGNHDVHALEWGVANNAGHADVLHALDHAVACATPVEIINNNNSE